MDCWFCIDNADVHAQNDVIESYTDYQLYLNFDIDLVTAGCLSPVLMSMHGADVVKAKAYLTEAKLAKLMHRSVTNRTSIPLLPPTTESKDNDAPTSPAALHRLAPLSPQSPVGLSPTADGNAAGDAAVLHPASCIQSRQF